MRSSVILLHNVTLAVANFEIGMTRKLSKFVKAGFIAALIALFHYPHPDVAQIAILTLSFVLRDHYSTVLIKRIINEGAITPLLDLIKPSSSVSFDKCSILFFRMIHCYLKNKLNAFTCLFFYFFHFKDDMLDAVSQFLNRLSFQRSRLDPRDTSQIFTGLKYLINHSNVDIISLDKISYFFMNCLIYFFFFFHEDSLVILCIM